MKKLLLFLLLIPAAAKCQTQFELNAKKVKVVSSNTTLGLFDIYTVVNTTAGNDTITIPPASSSWDGINNLAVVYHIKNIGVNSVYLRITPASGDSIEGSPNLFQIMPTNSSKEIQAASSHAYYIH